MRRYECLPNKLGNLHELMENLAIPVFKKLGMQVVGCWTPVVGDDENTLIYILAYEDMGARQKAWEKFWKDPEWIEGRAKLGAKFGGPVVSKSHSVFLEPTTYSDLK
jgi:hypothetical protein